MLVSDDSDQPQMEAKHSLLMRRGATSESFDGYLRQAEQQLSQLFGIYHPEVEQLAKTDEFRNGVVPMGLCTGPAVPIARTSAVVGWVALVASSGAAFATSTCDSEGFVYYPIQLWLCYIPIITLKLRWQLQCLKYTTIPFVQVAGSFKVIRSFNLGFLPWYILTTLMSIGQTMDYGTDGFFIAVILRAGQCPRSELEEIWHNVMSQSLFASMSNLSFTTIAIISYILLFLQPILAFLQSTPGCREKSPAYVVGNKSGSFLNCLGSPKNFGEALFDLADVSEMCSIQVQSPSFQLQKAQKAWAECGPEDRISRVLSHTHNALNRSLSRIGLVTLLENAYQINLQVSVLGIFCYIIDNGREGKGDHDVMAKMQLGTQVSIVLGVIQAVIKLGEVFQVLWFAYWTVTTLRSVEDQANYTALFQTANEDTTGEISEHFRSSGNHQLYQIEDSKRLSSEIAKVVGKAALVFISTLAFIILTAYAVVKLYFVLWVCEDRLWNFTGCVDMGRFRNPE